MGAILGLGVTHQPTLGDAVFSPGSFMRTLHDPELPKELTDPSSWPEGLRAEWSDDEGRAAGVAHRDAVAAEFRLARAALDDFRPDVLIVWGDDQYERFKENCVPPFAVLAQPEFRARPWAEHPKPNVWDEPMDTEFVIPGDVGTAKWLIGELLADGFDMSYSYASDEPLGHAFVKTAQYLDWDRRGFDYPMIPISLNVYGRLLTMSAGGRVPLAALRGEGSFDPPSPTPARCFDLGASVVRAAQASELRIALVASSSWSHGFLTEKHNFLYPDLEADRYLFERLAEGDYAAWREVSLRDIELSGQQEMLNWFCLAGAMAELGRRPTYVQLVETALFNSNKVFARFEQTTDAKPRP